MTSYDILDVDFPWQIFIDEDGTSRQCKFKITWQESTSRIVDGLHSWEDNPEIVITQHESRTFSRFTMNRSSPQGDVLDEIRDYFVTAMLWYAETQNLKWVCQLTL